MFRKLTVLIWISFVALPAYGAEEDRLGLRRSLMEEGFVVESSEADTADVLNRISGDIDLGFALPEQTYESDNQSKSGPFARQSAFDNSEAHGY